MPSFAVAVASVVVGVAAAAVEDAGVDAAVAGGWARESAAPRCTTTGAVGSSALGKKLKTMRVDDSDSVNRDWYGEMVMAPLASNGCRLWYDQLRHTPQRQGRNKRNKRLSRMWTMIVHGAMKQEH